MKLNNKGFSLIEILAVVVILGIVSTIGIVSVTRLIENSKKHYYESQQNNLVLAARAYTSDHKEVLPRNIGEMKKVELKTLYEKNYIKEKIVDRNKVECYKEDGIDDEGNKVTGSYVAVIKTSQTEYSYEGYLYCKSCGKNGNCDNEINDGEEKDDPNVNIKFPSNSGDTLYEKTSTIDLEYLANGDNALVESYSYKIYVDGKLVFNSGNKRNGKRPTINVHEPVYKYLPGKVKVVATITNTEGIVKSYSKTKDFSDAQYPSCGMVKYDMNNADTMTSYDSKETNSKKCGTEDFKWVNIGTQNGTRHAWVVCDDKLGIGCTQPEFSKLLDTDGETDKIIINDNEKNKNEGKVPTCTIMKCIDRTTPKLTVNIKSGTTIKQTYKVEGQHKELNYKKSDKYNVWLNLKDYPNGVTVEVIVEEPASKIKTFKWYQNPKEKKENQEGNATSKVKELTTFKDTDYDNKEKGILKPQTQTIKEDGVRKEVITVVDKAGNSITYTLILKIDRTPPTVPTTNLKKWKNANTRPTSSSGLSNYTNDTWFSGKVFTYPSGSSDKPDVSGLKEYQYKTTGKTSNETDRTASYRSVEAEGVSYIIWRSCDNAGNCSNYNTKKTIKLDRSKPTCKVTNSKNANGNGWYNSGTITATGNCTDQTGLSGCKAKSTQIQQVKTNSPSSAGTTKTITIYDNAGNSTTCTSTIKYDKSKPSCTVSKTHTGYTSGVTLTTSCSDSGPSGVNSCENKNGSSGNKTGGNSSKTYTYKVVDKAGNSNSCSKTVYLQKQRRDCSTCSRCSSATCAQWKYCQNSECGSHTGVTHSYGYDPPYYSSCTGLNGQFHQRNQYGDGYYKNCHMSGGKCRCTVVFRGTIIDSCRTSGCGCETRNRSCPKCGCDSWGSWYNVSSCSSSSSVGCQNTYK